MFFPKKIGITTIVLLLIVCLEGLASAQILSGKKIILDPGHFSDPRYQGTGTPVTSPAGKVDECYYVLDLAFDIKSLLELNGALVYLTRTTNNFIPYTSRINEVNSKYKNYDIWISLHENGSDNSTANGSGYVIDDYVTDADHKLGINVRDAVITEMGTVKWPKNLGVYSYPEIDINGKHKIYYTSAIIPARTLNESAFMTCTDKSEADYWMWTPEKKKLEARAIFNGVCSYFGITRPSVKINVDISSVDSSGFPEIKLYTTVEDISGEPVLDLGVSHFRLYEDQTRELPISVSSVGAGLDCTLSSGTHF